jgi:DNA-binding NtrC family response regulator
MRTHSVDLLVLDMIMEPGIDGLETYRRILKIHPGQKSIIASGYSESVRVKEAQRLGAGTYVKKPYLLKKIGRAIKAELDR